MNNTQKVLKNQHICEQATPNLGITQSSGLDHHAVYSRQRVDDFRENGVVSTQSARQHKDATDLVCQKAEAYAYLIRRLSFMSDKLLTVGNTVAALDELYIWLSNPTAIEYIRNCLKRVRKKESAMLLASQNLEDFDQEQVREMTKPLFSIPPHQFLFNAGSIDKRSYMEMLQLDEAEYNLIRFPQRGVCLYKCGNERYLLEVHAPAYKEKLFGTAGGR